MSESESRKSKSLADIKSGAFSRGFALARTSVAVGAKAAGHALGTMFSSPEAKAEGLKAMVASQMEILAKELGELKGSLMKVGQMLSVYGESFLPPEANAFLKTLQSQSPPLGFEAIDRVLRRQLSPERLAELEIEESPIASASLGQVHVARRKSDGARLVLKVQYPGVDNAIESDLKTLRRLLSMSKLIPRGPQYDELFKEVRQMLRHEVDYRRELERTEEFRRLLKDDPRYVIASVYPEYSSGRVIAFSYEEGFTIDSPEVLSLPQERRNALGMAFLELYLRELFDWKQMQTDPHFGNYRVRISKDPSQPDQLVLFDFGAIREFPDRFIEPYIDMVRGGYQRDAALVERGAVGLGFMAADDSPELKQAFAELCFMICEPFWKMGPDGNYDFRNNDLPKRAMRKGSELAFAFRLRPPPREVVFLDRKMGGVFILLSVLGVRANASKLLESFLLRN